MSAKPSSDIHVPLEEPCIFWAEIGQKFASGAEQIFRRDGLKHEGNFLTVIPGLLERGFDFEST